MAISEAKWLGSNISTDAEHRLVTDEQIAKWDAAGSAECVETSDWDTATTAGLYVSASTACANQPENSIFLGTVNINIAGDALVQELTDINSSVDEPLRYVRKASNLGAGWVFTNWYQYGLTKLKNKDDLAAEILQDFTYEKDSETGNYVLTGWKGTYNGEESSELIIPDTDEITIEI